VTALPGVCNAALSGRLEPQAAGDQVEKHPHTNTTAQTPAPLNNRHAGRTTGWSLLQCIGSKMQVGVLLVALLQPHYAIASCDWHMQVQHGQVLS